MDSFSDRQFQRYSKFIYDVFGIYLKEEKKQVLQNKLSKLMGRNNISSYDDFYDILVWAKDKQILLEFAQEITINKTEFFREINHFDFIKDKIAFILKSNERIIKRGEIRVWSSASSTGEESYTIAMVLKECLPQGVKIKILGTDISNRVLQAAQQGIYSANICNDVPPYYLQKYFQKVDEKFRVGDTIKELLTFRVFNLMSTFPFKNTFDIIFCRNVMIYFDLQVQQRLLDKFYRVLTPGGLLFIGHSESLTGKSHKFEYVQPTIYIK